jgi:uncharacterized membrane protein
MSLGWVVALCALSLMTGMFWLGRVIGLRYPLSATASVTTLVLWGLGVASALVAIPALLQMLLTY